MELEFTMNWLESISGPTWSKILKLYVNHVKHAKKAKFAGKTCPQNLSKQTRMTFLYPDRPTASTFMVTPKAKS